MRHLRYLAALAIIIPAGVVQGLWVGRWSAATDFDARLSSLHRIPLVIGEWSGRDIQPEENAYERAGVAGGLMRRYENGRGDNLTILIVCGKPGPTSVHTPETCFSGAGYEAIASRTRFEIARPQGPSMDHFWVLDMIKQDSVTPEFLRVFYAWSTNGAWRASGNPRMDFAGSSALFKLYVVCARGQIEVVRDDDPAVSFLRQLVPTIEKSLRPA